MSSPLAISTTCDPAMPEPSGTKPVKTPMRTRRPERVDKQGSSGDAVNEILQK